MPVYEYKVIPAPAKGRKAKGVKTPEARFALVLQETMNTEAANGWEYQRSDILPSEERQGLTSSHTVYRSVLVFRRALPSASEADVDETSTQASSDAQDDPDTVEDSSGAAEDEPSTEVETPDEAMEEDHEAPSDEAVDEAPSSDESSETGDDTAPEDDTVPRP